MSIRDKSIVKVTSLSKENEKLAKDIDKMEAVLEKHRVMLHREEQSLRGQIRKEVGGSRWVAGGKGQMSGYRSSKTLSRPDKTDSKPKTEPKKEQKKLKKQQNDDFQKPKSIAIVTDNAKEKGQFKRHETDIDVIKPGSVKLSSRGSSSRRNQQTVVCKQSSDQHLRTKSDYQRNDKDTATSTRSQRSGVLGRKDESSKTEPRNSTNDELELLTPFSERILTMKANVLSKASTKANRLKKKQGVSEMSERKSEISPVPTLDSNRDTSLYVNEKYLSRDVLHMKESNVTSQVDEKTMEQDEEEEEEDDDDDDDDDYDDDDDDATNRNKEKNALDDEYSTGSSSDTNDHTEHEYGVQFSNDYTGNKELNDLSPKEAGDSSDNHAVINSVRINSDGKLSTQLLKDESGKTNTCEKLNNEVDIAQGTKKPVFEKDPILYDPALSVWLYGLKLLDTDKYIQIFVDNEVTLEGVKLLTEQQLREMGITAMGPLSKIVNGIKTLQGVTDLMPCEEEEELNKGYSRSTQMKSDKKDNRERNDPTNISTKNTNLHEKPSVRNIPRSKIVHKHSVDSKTKAGKEIGKTVTSRRGETGKESRRIQSAVTLGGQRKEQTKSVKSRPVSAIVTQRSLASGVQAASHKLKRRKETQEKELQRKEKVNKVKKAERDKMAAQFHLKKKMAQESTSRKSSSSEADDDKSEPDVDEVMDELLTLDIKGLHGTSSRISTTAKPDDRKKTQTAQKSPKFEQSAVVVPDKNVNLVVQGDQVIESTRDKDSSRTYSHRSNKTVEVLPTPSSQEDKLQELEIQVQGLLGKGPENTEITIELVDKLQKQLQAIQEEISRKSSSGCDAEKIDSQRSDAGSKVVMPKVNQEKAKSPKSKETVTKRELMRKVRKQNEDHRKQIRHLEAELKRLKHKDPIRTFEIPENDIYFLETDLIGEGAFSQVFRGSYHGSEVAVKRLKTPLSNQDKNYLAEEVNLMRELRHPRVVLLLGVCTTCRHPIMVLEHMSKGSLYSWLHDPNRPPLDHVTYFQVARDTALGMNYLHRHKPVVLHMDLKSMNVLIGSNGRAKIGDFGFSKLRHDADVEASQSGSIRGTPAWMAPELLNPTIGEVTTKVDVYSFGIILWEMLTRQHPYEGLSVFQVMERVRLKQRPDMPDSTPIGLAKLINMCWDQKPNKRPSFKDILIALEGLSFPPEWRDLIAAAGISRDTMYDGYSARSIIDLVNKSVVMTQTELTSSMTVVPRLDLELSLDDVVPIKTSNQGEDVDIDSVSSDEDWSVPKDVKESIDDFVLSIPQSVLDAKEGCHGNGSHRGSEKKEYHVHLPWNGDDDVDDDGDVDTKSDSLSSRSREGSTKRSQESVQMSPTKSRSPERSVKFADEGSAFHGKSSHRSEHSERSVRASTAWQDNGPGSQEVKSTIPVPPPVPDLSQSAAFTQGARPKITSSNIKTQPLRRTVAATITPVKGQLTVPVSELLKQKARLKPATDPHPSQLADLTKVSQDKLTSIAEILKKAVTERRSAMGEDMASIEQSYPSGVWSLEEI